MLNEIKRRLGIQAAPEFTEKYPQLAQYPKTMEYLASLGISAIDLAAVYPEFEEYGESEFDIKGNAFRYTCTRGEKTRLDRVLFPSETYPYMLAVDRQERYIAPSKGIGVRTLPLSRVRLDVYPDTSVFLKLQRATMAHRTDMATFYIDSQGHVSITDLALMDDKYLNTHRGYAENVYPARLAIVSDEEAEKIIAFSQSFLEQGWELTLDDIAVPSAELTRKILTAPIDKGVNLSEMLHT